MSVLNLPILRWGRPYTSLETDDVVHFITGEKLARVSQANTGLLGRDMRLALRGGFNTAGTGGEKRSGTSLGAGLTIRQLDLDFAFVPYGALGNTFRYSARFRF